MTVTVYVSYAWREELDKPLVDRLAEACQSRGISLRRDKETIPYRGSIQSFMDQLGASARVVVVLSDSYLRSESCMYELMEIKRNGDFQKRVFPVVLQGTRLRSLEDHLEVKKYWRERIAKAKAEITEDRLTDRESTLAELKRWEEIHHHLDNLLPEVADWNALSEQVHLESNFSALLDALCAGHQPPPVDRNRMLRELAAGLREGRLVLCIGPAFAEAAGLPGWRELFRRLGCAPEELESAAADYPAFADQLLESGRFTEDLLKDQIATLLDQATPRPGPLHEALKALPVNLILTSNYDRTLEDLWPRSRLRLIVDEGGADHLNSADGRMRLVYLLGQIEQPREMVLANEELQGWRLLRRGLHKALQGALSGRLLLLLGYRSSDPLLAALLDLLPKSAAGHYAVLLGGTAAPAGVQAIAVADIPQLAATLEQLPRVAEGEAPTAEGVPSAGDPLEGLIRRPRQPLPLEAEGAGFESPPVAIPSYLPRRIDRFTGREREFQDLIAALERGGPVGITGLMGMGGIGKTSLAVEVAHHCRESGRFPGGVCWHTLGDKAFGVSLEELAAELGMEWLARVEGAERRKSAFRRALAGRRLLFVLDDANYPHRLPELLDLLAGHPVLVTSRANLSGLTHPFTVGRLPEEPARRLFLKGWRGLKEDAAADATFAALPPAAQAALDAVCLELLGGLPLALAIAAALAARRRWSPERLRGELERQRLALLYDPHRVDRRDAKDRDVRLSFDLSYQLLESETTRLALDVTGVFGSEAFSPEALAEAAGLEREATEAALADLADLSLLERDEDGRIRLHPLTREYAAERLAARPDQAPWKRMAHHYVELVRSHPKALAYDWRNALHAVQWCFERGGEYGDGLFLMARVDWFLYESGRWTVRDRWLDAAANIAHDFESPKFLYSFKEGQADQWDRQGYTEWALAAYKQLRGFCLRHPSLSDNASWCDYSLAALHRSYNQRHQALRLDLANLRNRLQTKDWERVGAVCRNIGNAFAHFPRLAQALECYTANQQIQAAVLAEINGSLAYATLFDCYHAQGDTTAAHRALHEMRAILDAHPHREIEGRYQRLAFLLALSEERLTDARQALHAFGTIAQELGVLDWMADSDYFAGLLHHAEGRPTEARAALERALAGYRTHGFTGEEGPCLRQLGLLATRAGDYRQARAWLDQARARAESHGGPGELARWEAAYALLQAHSGFSFDAVRGLRRALNSLAALGIGDLKEERRIEAELHTLLGDDYPRAEARLRSEGLEGESVDLREEEATLEPAARTITSPVDGREMLLIPSGLVRAAHHEHPFFLHPFYIDRYPVTHREYRDHLEAMGLPAPPHWPGGQIPAGLEERPVVGITWDEARGYAEWCGKQLPLAEEWEVAAGLREGREYPWGVEWDEAERESRLLDLDFRPIDFELAGDHRPARHWSRAHKEIGHCLFAEFDEQAFLRLLFRSFVDVPLKKKILDSMWTLSQSQIDSMINTFSKEANEQEAMFQQEPENVRKEQKRSMDGLVELEQIALYQGIAEDRDEDIGPLQSVLPTLAGPADLPFFSAGIAEWLDAPLAASDERDYADQHCKGGGWFTTDPECCKLSASTTRDPYHRTLDTGFRCVWPVFDKAELPLFLGQRHGLDSAPAPEQANWFLRRAVYLAARPLRSKQNFPLRTEDETRVALDHCRRALQLVPRHPQAVELYLDLKAAPDASLTALEQLLTEIDAFQPPPAVVDAWRAARQATEPGAPPDAIAASLDRLLAALEAALPDPKGFTFPGLPAHTEPRFRTRTTRKSQEYFLAMHREQVPSELLGPLLAAWRVVRRQNQQGTAP